MENKTYPDLPSKPTEASLESGKASSDAQAQILASLQLTVRKGIPQQYLRLDAPLKIDVKGANFSYGSTQALFDITLPIRQCQVTALIGPSGSGKSTFLRTLTRMKDLIAQSRTEGEAIMEGATIYAKQTDVVL